MSTVKRDRLTAIQDNLVRVLNDYGRHAISPEDVAVTCAINLQMLVNEMLGDE